MILKRIFEQNRRKKLYVTIFEQNWRKKLYVATLYMTGKIFVLYEIVR